MESTVIGPVDALGTAWYIELFETADTISIKKRLQDELNQFDSNYSRFLEESNVGIVNTSRKLQNPSEEFIRLLQLGQILYQITNGHFNFLTGGRQIVNGYGSTGKLEEISSIGNPLQDIIIETNSIQLISDSLIDLGGYGKGYFVDKFASILKDEFKLRYFLINGGGDLYVTSNNDAPVKIVLELPESKTNSKKPKYVGFVQLKNQSFCASSPFKRTWCGSNDIQHTHLLNPRNETESVETSSFIVAKTALLADVFATVFCISTDQKELQMLSKSNCFEFAQINASHQLFKSNNFPEIEPIL